tara:strand:- start:377 stop:613 length:237 start_codon:yes stop_codon:yes gene_type:complete
MKTIRITCIPDIEADEVIITGDVLLTLDKMDSYAVGARVVNAFRDWPNIYETATASDLITIIKSGGGKLSGSSIEVIK